MGIWIFLFFDHYDTAVMDICVHIFLVDICAYFSLVHNKKGVELLDCMTVLPVVCIAKKTLLLILYQFWTLSVLVEEKRVHKTATIHMVT